MYAVIKAGGKQQKVKAGDVIEVEYMAKAGETVTFHPLLVVDDDGATHFGKEAERAVVTAKPLGEQKGEKIKIFKYKNKSGYSRRAGHRQLMTLLEISDVSLGGVAPKKVTARKAEPKAGEPEGSEKPATPEKAEEGEGSEE